MKTRILKTGKGQKMQVYVAGKWYTVSSSENLPNEIKERRQIHKRKFRRNNNKAKSEYKAPSTQTGMPGGDKTEIDLTSRVSFLTGSATLRRNFELPIGTNGQEKILVVKNYAVSCEPKIYVKTHQSDTTIYTANEKGQVLHFICDGTYWYLVSTRYSTGGNEPGEWTTN